MDINLFSKCIRELIVENDRVDVPYLGSFVAEMQPATYSDRQTTIHPPYRKMSFHKEGISLEQGKLLLEKVMRESNVTLEQAGVELGWCLSRLSSELEGHKSCKLPGLGVMRANARNEFFFVPDEHLDIWPDGVGFESISIKVSEEEIPGQAGTRAERELRPEGENDEWPVRDDAPKAEEAPKMEEPIVEKPKEEAAQKEALRIEEPIAPAAASSRPSWTFPDPAHGRVSHSERQFHIIRLLLIVLAVLVVLFIAAAYLFTDELSPILDRLLYSKEELELLRR